MKKNLYYMIYMMAVWAFLLTGCRSEDLHIPADDGPLTVHYTVKVDDAISGRAIGDGTMAKNLTVVVCKPTGERVLYKELELPLTDGLDLTLLRGDYRVLFWLQCGNTYAIADDGQVSISYDGWTGNVADMERWDAFYAVDELTIGSEAQNRPVTLTRPLGQLNWAVENLSADVEDGGEGYTATVALTGVPTSFHPFGQGEVAEASAEPVTFTFSGLSGETLTSDGKTYSLLSGIYLFPADLSATLTLTQGEEPLLQKENVETTIETNVRTNLLTAIEPKVEDEPEQEPPGDEPVEGEPEGDENKSDPEGEGTTPENGGGEGEESGTEGGEGGAATGGEGTNTGGGETPPTEEQGNN